MTNLISAVNTPWAMTPEALSGLTNMFDQKLNSTDQWQALTAITQNTDFGQKQSSGWDAEVFTNASGEDVHYLKLAGTLVPRTGSMRPYCGLIPSIQIANIVDTVNEGTLIMHWDSGGGNIIGISELAASVKRAKERGVEVISFTDTLMASAAYWAACHSNTIVASPSAIVGSIGVYSVVTKRAENDQYKTHIFKAGGKKAFGHPNLEMTEEESEHFSSGVQKSYDLFVKDVALGLGYDEKRIRDTEAGTYTGLEAKGFLVHEVMTLTELMDKARKS